MIASLLLLASAAIAADFPEPEPLEANIGFWQRVYSEWTTGEVAFHDREYPGVVYRVVQLGDLRLHPRPDDPALRRARFEQRRELLDAVQEEISRGLLELEELWRSRAGALDEQSLEAPLRELHTALTNGGAGEAIEGAAGRLRRQFGLADRFYEALLRYDRYGPLVVRAFVEHGLPPDLAVLGFVESLFDPIAVSHAGAAGMFQFMPATGREYGLTKGPFWDLRLDPVLAADGAARMLRRNYERLGNWPLALTAYNHGPNGVARAVMQVGSSDLMVLIGRYRSPTFGFASKNFYAQFLAARRTLAARYTIFGDWVGAAPVELSELRLEAPVRPLALVRGGCMDEDTLSSFNPSLRPRAFEPAAVLPLGFRLKVPKEEASQVAACVANVVTAERRRRLTSAIRYRVSAGDTLTHIARRHGTSVGELIELNDLSADGSIEVGQVLRIPGDRCPD